MDIIFRQFSGPHDWGWIQKYVPLLRVQDTCGIMAIDKDANETVGAVIIDNVLNNSVQATIILKSPMVLRSDFIKECFEWIFSGLNKKYIFCLVAENNERSLRLCKRFGGIEKMRIPQGFKKGVDFIVMEIHESRVPNSCRYQIEQAA